MTGNHDKQRQTIIQLKNELSSAKQETLKLRRIIEDLKKGKKHLIPITEHEDLLQVAVQRARRAEVKASAFESELNNRYENGLYKSTPIPTDLQIHNFSELRESAPGLPTGARPWEKDQSPPSPRFLQRIPAGKRGDYVSLLGSTGSGSLTSVQYKISMKKNEQLAESKPRKTRKSFIARVQSILMRRTTKRKTDSLQLISGNVSDNHPQLSLLSRVHTKLFSRRRKRRSVYDVPDLCSLAQCNFMIEYEVPKDVFQDFRKTPLVVEEADSGEDSGWSTSDEADGTQQRQKTTGCRPIPSTKKEKPPLPPKPKSPSIPAPAVSPTTEKEDQRENFNQVPEGKPLKSYKRIQGPKGRQKPVRYSYLTLTADNDSDVQH